MSGQEAAGSATPTAAEGETEGDSGGPSGGPVTAQGNARRGAMPAPGNNSPGVVIVMLGPVTARMSVRQGDPAVGENGVAVTVVSPNVTSGVDRAPTGGTSASVGYRGRRMSSFCTRCGNKAGESHSSDGEEYSYHGFERGGYRWFDPGRVESIQGICSILANGERGEENPRCRKRVGPSTP